MPEPTDQFDGEQSKLPDDISSEPSADVESLGEAVPTADTGPAEENLSPDVLPAAEVAEKSAGPEPVEGEVEKRKKGRKKKEKIKKDRETETVSAGEEEGGRERKSTFSNFLQKITEASPYTVILGAAVIFLLIAVLCLLIELNRYHFDVNAKEAKERVAVHFSLDHAETYLLRG